MIRLTSCERFFQVNVPFRSQIHLSIKYSKKFLSSITEKIEADELPLIHPLLLKRAESMEKQFKVIENKMTAGGFDQDTNKEYSNLSVILDHYNRYKQDMESVQSLLEILNEGDPDLTEEAASELKVLLPNLLKSLRVLQSRLLPPVKHSDKAAILELRPGVGGSEAALFTEDLVNMYQNFCNKMKWKTNIILEARHSNGGISECILSVDVQGAYNTLRHESGVHRVQRIPETETKGRIHTSTAAVVVLPKVSDGNEISLKEDERHFGPGEVRIDTMRAGGKGGQHVNTTDSAVRLTHIPTGIQVVQQDERSQPRNKAKAFSILRARLAALDREKEIAEQKKLRTDQVTTTDRSDKIRTYNFPQNRITDHRCSFTMYDIEGCMNGLRLLDIIEKVEEYELEDRLQSLIALSKIQ